VVGSIRKWLASDSAKRVMRTAIEVFGPVAVLFLLDFGHDGVVVVRDYIFGDSGFIVAGTIAFALAMNIRTK